MKKPLAALILGLAATALTAGAALAQEPATLRASRIGAADPAKLAEFYTAAYGFQEVRRINGDGFLEVIMRAKDAPAGAASLVIITKSENLQMGGLAYVILGVTDLARSVAATEAAGGTVFRKPKAPTARYVMMKDPEGNQIELLQAN
ncbi:MAG: VOC family protein [Alphaproteobacteria bacterium]|nr:VOC family protein [Alphaproteobacteria bacterium]